MNDFFNTLGIEATKEEKKIKKAYRARLHAVNPEDDPDGFKRLREAYEEALKYARQKEEEPENLSPAEEFISRCEQLYKDFYRRIDEQEWEKLFSEDICISLESGEEVRQRFLVFLMENFRLPSPVWKKIDQTFSITGNRKELLELFPEPYVDFLQQVVRYNGALNYELFEGDVSEDVDDYIEHYHKLRQYADLGMRKEAWEEYHFIEANYDICHPYILLEKARLLYSDEERKKQEEGGEIFRSLAKKYPQEERIVCCYGRYCQEKDTWDGTIALYDAVLEAHPESFLARTGKMESILHEGRYREARESILDLLEESPVDERLVADLNKANVYVIAELEPKYKDSLLDQDGLMELAWCYYQNSRFEDGIALMDGFVPDEEHYLDYHNLKGRIFLTVNKDAEALEHLVPWLHAIQKLRPDGTKKTTRQMARLGYAYYTIASAKADLILDGQEGSLLEVMDYIEKAVEAEQDFSQKVSYYHTAADIWRRKKEYAKMFDICDKIIALDPQYYPAYLLRQEACLYLGRYQEVINDYQRATALYPYHARPYCTLIRMYLSFGEQDRVKDILQLAKENGANSDELELLRARYIAIRAKSRKDLEKALSILEKLEKKGWSLQSEMDEEEWAAIAYGLYQKNDNTRFLVFDLGGGTFDVSILELFDDILEVRAVAGDNYLGGEDFTNLIVEEFYKEHGLTEESLSLKEKSYYRNQAEKSKCNATGDGFYRMQASVNGEKVETLIPRGAFEKMSSQLLDRIKTPVRKSLSDAGVKAREIDEVVLVGGTTKMPLVRKFVGKLFGRVPDTSINPDEAVALGAAIQAAMKERKEAVKEVILTDVCPFTLGTEVSVKTENDHLEGNHFCPIIERNTVIPASRTQHFFTVYDHQTQVEIHILQGESRFASNNVSLGTLKLTVPDNEAGKEQIDITYTYDINALLEVEAKIVSTGETVTRLIKNQENSMTEEEMKARMRELSYLKIPPREQEKNKVLLLRGERLYEETTGELREQLEMVTQQFERILDRQDPLKIEEARKDYEEALDWIEEEMWI